MAQIHRFRDNVAISLGTGTTVYLSEKEARQIARALYAVARSVRTVSFVNSEGTTHQIPISQKRY